MDILAYSLNLGFKYFSIEALLNGAILLSIDIGLDNL